MWGRSVHTRASNNASDGEQFFLFPFSFSHLRRECLQRLFSDSRFGELPPSGIWCYIVWGRSVRARMSNNAVYGEHIFYIHFLCESILIRYGRCWLYIYAVETKGQGGSPWPVSKPPPPSVHVLCYTFSLGRSICVVSTNQQVSCNLFTFPCNTQQELVNFTCIHYVDRAVATFEDSY